MTVRQVQVAVGVGGVAVALAALGSVYACHLQACAPQPRVGPADALLWTVGGLAYLGVGLVAWRRRPDNRVGLLMVAVGLAWFAFPDDDFLRSSLARTWSPTLTYFFAVRELWIPVLVALVAAFPSGRLRRCDKLVVGGIAGFYVLRNLSIVLFWHPPLGGWGPVDNLLLVRADPLLLARIEGLVFDLDEPILLALVGWILWRWWRSSVPMRRAMAPLLWAGVPWVASFALGTVRLVFASDPLRDVENFLGRVGLLALPFGLLAVLLHRQLFHTRLGRLLQDLSRPMPGGTLQPRLAEALGDPSLTVAFARPDGDGYVDSQGHHLRPDAPPPGRAVTYVEGARGRAAALVHDPALSDDRDLLAAATSAVRLALDNERLHATIRAQLEEVRASRARIVEAADAERRRIERDLHDGAQQRLVTLGMALRMTRERLGVDADPAAAELIDHAIAEAGYALDELRELARGLHPAILAEGLRPAVEDLVDRLPVPVDVEVSDRWLPEPQLATAYFVIAEALTNVAKHAHASRASVRAQLDGQWLQVGVDDDGVGGADPDGSGLMGLSDRVAAADGDLHVSSDGRGTRVTARIPVAWRPATNPEGV